MFWYWRYVKELLFPKKVKRKTMEEIVTETDLKMLREAVLGINQEMKRKFDVPKD
jgi:hypothetical protein